MITNDLQIFALVFLRYYLEIQKRKFKPSDFKILL